MTDPQTIGKEGPLGNTGGRLNVLLNITNK